MKPYIHDSGSTCKKIVQALMELKYKYPVGLKPEFHNLNQAFGFE